MGTEAARRLLAAMLFAAAVPGATAQPASPLQVVAVPLTLGDQSLQVRWTLPAAQPRGFALLQHGFTRRCEHLDGLMRRWAAAGLAVACVDVSGVPGGPWLPADVADAMTDGRLRLPGGRALPDTIVVAGHSAGAAFALRVGTRLISSGRPRVAGAVLFDPVAPVAPVDSADLADDIVRFHDRGSRPVRALLSAPGPCNAQGSGAVLLSRLQARELAGAAGSFVVRELGAGSTHIDAEGEHTTPFAVSVCSQGAPRADIVEELRAVSAQWAAEMIEAGR